MQIETGDWENRFRQHDVTLLNAATPVDKKRKLRFARLAAAAILRSGARTLYVLGLGSLVAVDEFVFYVIAFMQGLVSRSKNAGMMNEDVHTLFLSDKTEAPSVIEPFNLTAGHNSNPSMIQR